MSLEYDKLIQLKDFFNLILASFYFHSIINVCLKARQKGDADPEYKLKSETINEFNFNILIFT
jgi:hypothetical protein